MSKPGNPQATQETHKETPYYECVCNGVCVSTSMCTHDAWRWLVFQPVSVNRQSACWYLNRNSGSWNRLWTSKWERQLKESTRAAKFSRGFTRSFRNVLLRAIFSFPPIFYSGFLLLNFSLYFFALLWLHYIFVSFINKYYSDKSNSFN